MDGIIEFGDGTVSIEKVVSNKDHSELSKEEKTLNELLDIYIDVYKGEPWTQDLSEEKDNLLADLVNNNVSIQPITSKDQSVGFHFWKDGSFEGMEDFFIDEYKFILSSPVNGQSAIISDIDFEKLQSELQERFPNDINLYYLLDIGLTEDSRNSMIAKLSMIKSIVDQLVNHDQLLAQTLDQGPLFDIIKDVKGIEILQKTAIPNSDKNHILFTISTSDLLENSNLFKVASKGSRLLSKIKISPIIHAGKL